MARKGTGRENIKNVMAETDQPSWRKLYPNEPVLIPALKVGAWSGASGFLVGGVGGIIRSPTPGLFAIASSLQWATLGTTYYATRGVILRAWQVDSSSPPQDRVYPSTLAGGMTGGTIGGLIRGRTNIIPGMIVFSLLGFAGQHIYNTLDARQSSHTSLHQPRSNTNPSSSDVSPTAPHASNANQPFWKRALDSKWSPMKILSDEEYEKMLKQKLLRVEAEIAILDEDIAKVQTQMEAEKRLKK
ncbi:MAG: hypothetical protein Q9201_007022 [Fulgogasparrea decipioides]